MAVDSVAMRRSDVHNPRADRILAKDGELYYIIHNGIRLTGMPAWGDPQGEDDHWAPVLFIRHLPKLTRAEEQDMERFNPISEADRQQEAEGQQAPIGQGTKAAPYATPHEHGAATGK